MWRPCTDVAAVAVVTRGLAASMAARYAFDWSTVTSWSPNPKPRNDWAVGIDGSMTGVVWNGSQPGWAMAAWAGKVAIARIAASTGTRRRLRTVDSPVEGRCRTVGAPVAWGRVGLIAALGLGVAAISVLWHVRGAPTITP